LGDRPASLERYVLVLNERTGLKFDSYEDDTQA
jgi:hypothetical protein